MARSDPSQRRKTKRDKKAKAKYKPYKKGGSHRSTKIKLTNKE
ncbi:MAG: hypothetical protein ABII03_01155 [Nanoarchaeota archaeon]